MDITIFGLILMGCFGVILAIVMISQGNKAKSKINSNKQSLQDNSSNSEGVIRNKEKDVPKKDIMGFMEFDKIIDDMILQEKETKYTMVVQCKGINYDLMSEIEQLGVEEGFITFLNTLKFPIQLYVQARAIDLKKSMGIYKENVTNLSDQYDLAEERLKTVASNLNSTDREINEAKVDREKYSNILEYAQDITRYMERLSLNKHILQRKFYVVLSYYKSEVTATAEFTKDEIYEICHRELYTRAQTIISALQACSVTSKVLTSNELAELLYISYNRDDEKLLDINTALESGFYRLYSTSEDVYDKKQKLMQKEIDEEANKRVREAIKETLDADKIKTQDELIEEFEKGADHTAVNIIRNSDIDEDTKKDLTNKIAQKHVINAQIRRNARIANMQENERIKQELENKKNDIIEEKTNTIDLTNEKINIDKSEESTIVKENKISSEDDSII